MSLTGTLTYSTLSALNFDESIEITASSTVMSSDAILTTSSIQAVPHESNSCLKAKRAFSTGIPLLESARLCDGFSGRSLRKLPFLAYTECVMSASGRKDGIPLLEFFAKLK